MEEPEIARLYEVPLEQFTPARDQLAARLKVAGDAAESSRVKSLRKPTAPAWVVNQLARRHPAKVEALVAASDRVRRAQQEVLEGGAAGDLWEATLAEREAVSALVADAERILTDMGYGATRGSLDRVSDTLTAAASDPSARMLLRKGLLTQEMRRAGFGDVIAAPPSATRPKGAPKRAPLRAVPAPPRPKPGRGAAKRPSGPTAKQVLDAEREATRAARDADRADADAERYARASERAEEEARQARKRADAAERTARGAAAEATAARKEAAEARREADRAALRLEKIRRARF